MKWVHKSVDVRPEVWRKLRINSELSSAPVRDFLAYLIEQSEPVRPGDDQAMAMLRGIGEANRAALGSKE